MINNVKLEGSEKFIVSIDPLSLPYGVVLGDHPTAEVVIMDNGGKLYTCVASYLYLVQHFLYKSINIKFLVV